MTFTRRLTVVAILATFCLTLAAQAQNAPSASPASTASASPVASATAAPTPTAVPLPDIVSAADAALQRLEEIESDVSSKQITENIARNLGATTKEIDARADETQRMLTPGVPLETLRDLESRWQKLSDQVGSWGRNLTDQATTLDRQVAQMSDLRTTWQATRDLALKSSAPPEVVQRVDDVLTAIDRTEGELQKRRATVLGVQTRVAEQTQRVQGALRSIKSAQSAAVNRLWVQDSPPVWTPEVRTAATQALVRESQVSLGAQLAQLSNYVRLEWTKFAYLGLLFIGLALVLVRVKRQAARWTDRDPTLERANRVLALPFATAAVLSFILSRFLLSEAPRLVWVIFATVALIPIVILLRRLIARDLYPIINALVVFYFIAQLRALGAAIPILSRIILLLETIGGAIFFAWFVRSRRRASPQTTSSRTTRAAANIGVIVFAVVAVMNLFGYVGLANYLAAGVLAAAYLAIVLYAATGILEGLVSFALQIRPLAALAVVRHHRPLLRRRIGGLIRFTAIVTWILLSLNAFAFRNAVIGQIRTLITAEVTVRSFHLSLGAVLGFGLIIWITLLLSRFIRFVLEEEIYQRVHLARGSAYAVSTLIHYVVLLVGFYAAIAALGADMTKTALLAGAVGVGVGFGLQNIFNNFFSGLILLFERPVQVGDVIEVAGQTGVVRRIGIRASTIILGDNSQLIIPNGQLISDKVTNRTVSSRQKRMELTLRIAYGHDPERVIELLTKTAAANPKVAKDPAPDAVLKEFGTDALLFVLGFSTDDLPRVSFIQSDVAIEVNRALRHSGIEIPYPQRIVHLEKDDDTDHESLGRRQTGARSDGTGC